jgi:type I restriction enzyme S subunit
MTNRAFNEVPIGSVCDGIFDGPHATPPKVDAGPVFLGISNLVNGRVDLSEPEYIDPDYFIKWTRRVEPRENDLVFSYETRLGECALIPKGLKCCLGRRMALARPDKEKVNPRFLLYSFLGPAFQDVLRKHTVHGSTVNRIPLIEFPKFPLRLPDRDTQDAIAGLLGALDDKIEQNRRTAAKLEALARATFRAWFVDFAPVHAKAAGATFYPGLPPAAFAALPTTFTDSPLGPIPEGWEAKPLDEACTINPPLPLKKGHAAPYLDMKNMPTQGHRPNEVTDRPFSSGMRFQNGDTLVARITPCLENGKTAFVDFLDGDKVGWGSTEFIVIRPKPPLPPLYGYCLARTGEFRDFSIQNMSGTSGRQRVPATAMSHYFFAVPNEPVAAAFGQTIGPLFDLIRAGDEESSHLAALRDYLLPRLLSGAVRVRTQDGSNAGGEK